MAKLTVGTLSTFNHELQDWLIYKDRLEQWFFANDVGISEIKAGCKRRAILLSSLAEHTYKLVRDLSLPREVGNLSYEEVVTLLDKHFKTEKCGFAERFKFHTATQQVGESPADWAARVRGLAVHCAFGPAALDEVLRDRFVLGMQPGVARDKLFTADMAALTLNSAREQAEAARCAQEGARLATDLEPLKVCSVAAGRTVQQRGYAPAQPKLSPSGGNVCAACGYVGHSEAKCRFARYQCRKCGVKGHLKRMCPEKFISRQQCYVERCGDDDDGKRLLCNIRSFCGEPMKESVLVGSVKLHFEVDTGSAVTVISESLYLHYFSHIKLRPSNILLQGYSGNKINTLGVINLNFVYKGRSADIDVFVVINGGPPLLGRDFMSQFNLQILSVNACSDIFANIIVKYPKLFSNDLGRCKDIVVNLKLKPDAKPIFCKARTIPFALKDRVEAELNRLVLLGILEPVKYSEYASPIVPVLRQDNKIRICVDYSTTINKQLIIEQYPLPGMDVLFSKLHGGQHFSKLDLSQAYNQFCLSEQSQMLTTINTHKGLFKYTRLAFGLSSAPAIFQRAMEGVLAGLDKGVLLFLDDILITGKTESEHISRLHEVCRRLEGAGLVLQKEKCVLFQDSVSYLGFTVDRSGIHKSPDKIKAIISAKTPTNVTELKSFLGLVNYYRQFVKNASCILSPLHCLLQKNVAWEWGAQHDKAVAEIKKSLAADTTLAHFNPDAKLILTVDASPFGLGAILSQVENGCERPVSYMSRSLNPAEKRYSQIQKEATAIIFGVRKFHQYLYGRLDPFVLRTDHKPLLSIFSPDKGVPEISANRLQRYSIFLSAYNYKIEYVSSALNSADFLSRSVSGVPLVDESEPDIVDSAAFVNFVYAGDRFVSLPELRHQTSEDKVLSVVTKYVQQGWPRKNNIESLVKPFYECRLELSMENDVLMRGHRVVVPTIFRETIIKELHRGHLGITKMRQEARDRFWWPGMGASIEQCTSSCGVCLALRPSPPHAPLTPWPYPPSPWYRVHVDFLGPIHNKMFLIVIDAYSKWVECYDVSSGFGSRIVIEKLCEVMSRFGMFNTICSDNGTSFTSLEFKEFCRRNDIEHITSPAYNPASNGQAESYVKIIKKAIKSIILSGSNMRDLNVTLCEFLLRYRNSKHSTTDRSPSEILFGRKLKSRLDLINPTNDSPSASSDASLDKIVKNKQSSQCNKYKGNRKILFKVNELVLVKVFKNLKSHWLPGIVIEVLGKSVYLVRLCNDSILVKKHTNQLLKYKGEENVILNDIDGTDNTRVITGICYPSPPVTSVAQQAQPATVRNEPDDVQRLDKPRQAKKPVNYKL